MMETKILGKKARRKTLRIRKVVRGEIVVCCLWGIEEGT